MIDQVWTTSLDRLRDSVEAQHFTRWIEPMSADSLLDGVLLLRAPNSFIAEWVQKNYAELITENVRAVEPTCRMVSFTHDVPPSDGAGMVTTDTWTESAIMHSESPASTFTKPQVAVQAPSGPQTLNPKYTFDTFITGPSNNFAFAATQAVAKASGRTYNPLFLYGGVGLGKTHLMHAIGHAMWLENRNATILYMSSEEFTNEMITSIQTRSTAQFRAKYRSVDLLLIDDIQFIAGRESTQEEFFHTFNTLYDAQKQIVLTSDRPPKEIPTLQERLVSRFQWGLVTDVQPPDAETRVAILKAKALVEGIGLPQDVAHFIAQTITTNIRELEGALTRVWHYAETFSKPITMDIAQQALDALVPTAHSKPLSIERIQQVVATHFDVRMAELKGSRRSRQIVQPRQIAMYLCRELTSASLVDVGKAFGDRDHTTVMHACRKITEDGEKDEGLRHTIELLSGQLRENA